MVEQLIRITIPIEEITKTALAKYPGFKLESAKIWETASHSQLILVIKSTTDEAPKS